MSAETEVFMSETYPVTFSLIKTDEGDTRKVGDLNPECALYWVKG